MPATKCTALPDTQLANQFGNDLIALATFIGGLYRQRNSTGLHEAEHVLQTMADRARGLREDIIRRNGSDNENCNSELFN